MYTGGIIGRNTGCRYWRRKRCCNAAVISAFSLLRRRKIYCYRYLLVMVWLTLCDLFLRNLSIREWFPGASRRLLLKHITLSVMRASYVV